MSNHIQPRPVVNASRWIAGLALIANGTPPFLLAFGVISWTVDQLAAYEGFVGVLVAAVSMVLGLRVEERVTPVASPRDESLVPLVPIAEDGIED